MFKKKPFLNHKPFDDTGAVTVLRYFHQPLFDAGQITIDPHMGMPAAR